MRNSDASKTELQASRSPFNIEKCFSFSYKGIKKRIDVFSREFNMPVKILSDFLETLRKMHVFVYNVERISLCKISLATVLLYYNIVRYCITILHYEINSSMSIKIA